MNTHKRWITSHPSCQTRPVKGTCVSSAFELLRKLLHHNSSPFPCNSNAIRISATQLSQIQHVNCSFSGPSARCGGCLPEITAIPWEFRLFQGLPPGYVLPGSVGLGPAVSTRSSSACAVHLPVQVAEAILISALIQALCWKAITCERGSTGCIDLPTLLHVLSVHSTYLYLDVHLHQ